MEEKKTRIVIDTNILISALINPKSVVWDIIEIKEIDFLVPEIAVDEIKEYEKLIKEKLRKTERKESYEYLISELFKNVIVVPVGFYKKKISEAYQVMKDIDEKDTEFLALALAFKCPILSEDKGFRKQRLAMVFTVKEFVEKLL